MGSRPGSARVVRGKPVPLLRRERDELNATLVVFGGRRSSRFLGIMLGDTGTELLHDAVCSVLLARPTREETWRPRRIVVGLDSSGYALAALSTADELAGNSAAPSKWCLRPAGMGSTATSPGRIEFRAGIPRMRPTHSSSGLTPPTSSSSDHAVCTVSAHWAASVSASHTRLTARCSSFTSPRPSTVPDASPDPRVASRPVRMSHGVIVVGVDGSEFSNRGLRWGGRRGATTSCPSARSTRLVAVPNASSAGSRRRTSLCISATTPREPCKRSSRRPWTSSRTSPCRASKPQPRPERAFHRMQGKA